MRILLIEDNKELVSLLVKGLEREEMFIDSVANAADATSALATIRYGAIVLDLGLPDQDGLVWLRDLRERGDSTPVLVLTARAGVTDRVTGLRAGADDYLVKPFAMEELAARLRALMRRSGSLLGNRLTLGNVTLDTETRLVTVDDKARPFSIRETSVLEILLRRHGSVAPKRLFEDHLFGLSEEVGSNAVEVYIHRLRRLLVEYGANVLVHTVRGVGYMLAEANAAAGEKLRRAG